MRWKFLSLSLYSQQMVSGGLPRHTLATRNTCTVARTALRPGSDGQLVLDQVKQSNFITFPQYKFVLDIVLHFLALQANIQTVKLV